MSTRFLALSCVLRFGVARQQIERPLLVIDDLQDQQWRRILPGWILQEGPLLRRGQQDVLACAGSSASR